MSRRTSKRLSTTEKTRHASPEKERKTGGDGDPRSGKRSGLNLSDRVSAIFQLDPRSVAAFRIGLAILILIDLVDRSRDLTAHYTDWGVLPRSALIDLFLNPSVVSFHLMNGTWPWQLGLFVLAGLTALGLLVGYRTRLMTVASWLLLVSLQSRNPFLLQGGDILFRMSLFWGMFLPLGVRWSIDRYRTGSSRAGESEPRSMLSWATAAVVVQVVLVFVVAGLLKTGPEWTEDNTAVYYAMSIDHLTTPIGHWLLGYPGLMEILTYLTLRIELFAPLLFLIPFHTAFFRLVGIGLLLGMQVGFGATIRIFLFPWICFVATLPLLPTVFWDKVSVASRGWSQRAESFLHRMEEAGVSKRLGLFRPAQGSVASTPTWMNVTAAFFLGYVIFWNLGTLPSSVMPSGVGVPRQLEWIGYVLRVDQHWNMFAPAPLKDDGWYVMPGWLLNGRNVDVFRGGAPVTWEKPELVAYTYKNQRWQRYMVNLWNREYAAFREFYGGYVCRAWNDVHDGGSQLDRFTIYFMREDTLPDGEAEPERVPLWEHYCFQRPEY